MLKTTKNWLLLEDKDEAPHVWGPWITIKKTVSLVLNTLHHFQLHPHQDLASHEGGEILLEEHSQIVLRACVYCITGGHSGCVNRFMYICHIQGIYEAC